MLKLTRILAIFAIGVLLAAALQPAIANPLQDVIATPETISVSDEYGAVMAAVNEVRTGDVDPSLDSDGDGISDYDEINGFTWGNKTYFTNPYMASTDRDPYDDYMEITGINMPTAVRTPGRHPCVPSSPDLGIDLEGIDVTTLTTISSTQTKEQGNTWSVVTETGWSINPEVGIEAVPTFNGGKPEVGITASGKISGEYHSKTTETTSKWSREEWSSATAVDTGEAAKLKFHVKIRNTGMDAAKNVKLKFNVMIGEEGIVDTIWTDVIEWSINPDEVSDEMVISKDREGNDIVVSLDELKSIESGTPITIKITEINAEVPWEGGWTTWNDYKGEIEPVSSKIMVDFGGGDAREYDAWAGLHLLAEPPHPTIHDISLWEAINRTVGVEDKEDGIFIGGKRMEKGWEFIFDNETAVDVEKKLEDLDPDWNLYDMLNLTIEPGWTLLVKAPDAEPPEIHWASYSEDRKMILASVSDNEQVKNVTAHVKVGASYEDIELKDDDGDSIFTATSSEKITDTYDDYVIADDGTFTSIWNDIRLFETPDCWPMFHHDARHTGYSNSSAPNDIHLLWSITIGERIYSSPAVVNGKVFVIAVTDIPRKKAHDYQISCFDETNGTLLWQRPIKGELIDDQFWEGFPEPEGNRMYSSPTVADDKVFFGIDDGKLYCLDEDNGNTLGEFKISELAALDEMISLTPATVADGKVFFQAFHEKYNGFIYTYYGMSRIFCLDLDDGLTMNWESWAGNWWPTSVGSNSAVEMRFQSSPAVADGMVFFGTYNGHVRCFAADTVKDFRWDYYANGRVVSSPAVADGMVFVGSLDNKIDCLYEINGTEKWNFSTDSDVYSTPAVANGKVFVGAGPNDKKIYCLDEYNGTEIWSFTTGGAVHSSPAVADGKVFVGSNDGKIYCLDEDDGTEIWSYQTGGTVYSSPAVANGKVFVGSNDGKIYCFGPPGSNSPTASIIAISPATAMQGEDNITFEGEGTDNGYVKDYLWTSNIDGNISTSASFNISASDLSVGTHSIFFKVQDDDELWSTQEVGYVTVTAPNTLPVVAFNASPEVPFIDEAVTFNASHSYDPDGFIKRYTWDFGDGATATGKVVTHAYPEAGDYNVTLNVTDYYGLTNETTQIVSIYYPLVQNLNTGESFATIQAAIDDNDTQNGHTLLIVEPWAILENVEVTKSLTIRSANGTATSVQAADSNEHVFNVTVDNVTISGFTVSGATGIGKAGIYLTTSEHCNLSSNTITNNYHGIFLTQSASNNRINFNNIAGNLEYGVYNDNTGVTVDAESNWWGSASGPGGAGPGTGDNVSDNVDYDPWLGDESQTETVTDGTLDAKAEADTEVYVDGTATVTVAQYTANPEGNPPSGFSAAGGYIDVYVGDTTGVTQIEVRKYYTDAEIAGLDESSLRLRYWNGAAWAECSDSGVNTGAVDGYSGYVWARITDSTTPDLTYLEGGVFGALGAPPTPTAAPSGGSSGGGGGGAPRDSDGDGYDDIQELIAGTDPNDPNDYPGSESAATPTPAAPSVALPKPASTPAPAATPEPAAATPTPEEPGFEGLFAVVGLLAVVYLLRRRR